jgi:ABC-type transport system involved in multi-copper enzyme maturation permease subunit
MLKTIIEKELRDVIGSTKFAIGFGVCAVLILLSFYSGASSFLQSRAQYEAAVAENVRQMEGITNWLQLQQHRIFLKPQPITSLVTGVSNDIGRTIAMQGRGELTSEGSRFAEEPVLAVFRFLDLEFLFQVVLSLFAILLGYNAISGEKEQGTLKLSFANAVPKDTYILGKLIGSYIALVAPLVGAMLLGALVLPLMGVAMGGAEWVRLVLVMITGLLYFAAFLSLAILVSASTMRSADSFLILLVIWIGAVLVIPRASVQLAGRAVEVPSVDSQLVEKAKFSYQQFAEDRKAMNSFKPSGDLSDPMKAMGQFNKFMDSLADERQQRANDLAARLKEDRTNKQSEQQSLAFALARLSPASSLSLSLSALAGTSATLGDNFVNQAMEYQKAYAQFFREKTGVSPGGRMIMIRMTDDSIEKPKPVDPTELPQFVSTPEPLEKSIQAASFDMGLLALFTLLFAGGAYFKFLHYDVR